jgi:hypothetical protein
MWGDTGRSLRACFRSATQRIAPGRGESNWCTISVAIGCDKGQDPVVKKISSSTDIPIVRQEIAVRCLLEIDTRSEGTHERLKKLCLSGERTSRRRGGNPGGGQERAKKNCNGALCAASHGVVIDDSTRTLFPRTMRSGKIRIDGVLTAS